MTFSIVYYTNIKLYTYLYMFFSLGIATLKHRVSVFGPSFSDKKNPTKSCGNYSKKFLSASDYSNSFLFFPMFLQNIVVYLFYLDGLNEWFFKSTWVDFEYMVPYMFEGLEKPENPFNL